MASYNYFGATAAQLVALFPGTATADFVDTAALNGVLGRIAREVAGAFAPMSYSHLAEEVTLELAEDYATAAQTTVQLGCTPIVSGSLRLWSFAKGAELNDKPVWGESELAHTVVVATGVVTLSSPLSLGDRVFATYVLDTEAAAFSWPSVADVVLLGAAAEFGARLYSAGDQEWKLVDDFKERYRGRALGDDGTALGLTRSGAWVPDELRTLKFWTEVERSGVSIGSVRKYRS